MTDCGYLFQHQGLLRQTNSRSPYSHAVLVDHGLMRLNECAEVKETIGKHLGIDLTVVDASERFMAGLAGVTDPEKKRKFIGNTL